jgi:hypothetical protein
MLQSSPMAPIEEWHTHVPTDDDWLNDTQEPRPLHTLLFADGHVTTGNRQSLSQPVMPLATSGRSPASQIALPHTGSMIEPSTCTHSMSGEALMTGDVSSKNVRSASVTLLGLPVGFRLKTVRRLL